MSAFLNAGLTECHVFMVICAWNVQNSLPSRFSCFILPHLLKYSYHPVSLPLPCPPSPILLLSLPSSFFLFLLFFFHHSFFIALSISSILLPARLHLFFLTSLSFFPVFQPWLFPPSFTVILPLSWPISLTFCALLSFPLCPSFSFNIMPYPHQNRSPLFSSLLLFLEYIIFHTSWHHQSLTDPASSLSSALTLPSVPRVLVKGRYEPTNATQLTANHNNEFLKMTLIYKIIFKKIY